LIWTKNLFLELISNPDFPGYFTACASLYFYGFFKSGDRTTGVPESLREQGFVSYPP